MSNASLIKRMCKLQRGLNRMSDYFGYVYCGDIAYVHTGGSGNVVYRYLEGPVVERMKATSIKFLESINPIPQAAIDAFKGDYAFTLDSSGKLHISKIHKDINLYEFIKNAERVEDVPSISSGITGTWDSGQTDDLYKAVSADMQKMCDELEKEIGEVKFSELFEKSDYDYETYL